jgi:aspartokinase-like uncharacterized kinase
MAPDTIVKVGGSLYDLPHLGARLGQWLAGADLGRLVLVPGGGDTAEAVRRLKRCHGLDEELCHWLALRALTLNAHFLAGLLGRARVVERLEDCPATWQQQRLAVLDLHAFAWADESRPGRLAHSWDVTSDSLAARVAAVAGARRLVLLKSVDIPMTQRWQEAARAGLVDAAFDQTVRQATGLQVEVINFRSALP